MKKHRDSLILIAIAIILISVLILLSAQIANADYVAPEVQTQVNKQTDLFQKSVNNLPEFTRELEKGKQVGIDSIGDGTSTPQGLTSITKKSKSELENEGEQLSAINEHELDGKGRTELIKNNTINELYIDYSRPLNKQYMRDAKTIAEAQNRLLDNLLAILKEKAGTEVRATGGSQARAAAAAVRAARAEAKILSAGDLLDVNNQVLANNLIDSAHARVTSQIASIGGQMRNLQQAIGDMNISIKVQNEAGDSYLNTNYEEATKKFKIALLAMRSGMSIVSQGYLTAEAALELITE